MDGEIIIDIDQAGGPVGAEAENEHIHLPNDLWMHVFFYIEYLCLVIFCFL